jgi:hypothetical protein
MQCYFAIAWYAKVRYASWYARKSLRTINLNEIYKAHMMILMPLNNKTALLVLGWSTSVSKPNRLDQG